MTETARMSLLVKLDAVKRNVISNPGIIGPEKCKGNGAKNDGHYYLIPQGARVNK